jgi:hypothetical protein
MSDTALNLLALVAVMGAWVIIAVFRGEDAE